MQIWWIISRKLRLIWLLMNLD